MPCLTPSHGCSSEIIRELFLLFRSGLCLYCWSLPFMKTSKIKLACFYFLRSSSHIKILITAATHPHRCTKCYNSGNCNINIFGGHFLKILYIHCFLKLQTWLWVFQTMRIAYSTAKVQKVQNSSPLRQLFCPPQSSGWNFER